MALINDKGFINDGSKDLDVGGSVTVRGTLSASAGAYAELVTQNNNLTGQNLGTANTWV